MARHPPVNHARSWRSWATFHTDMTQGVFFFFGCLLMILGAVGEWIIGNTFPFVVFGTFGRHKTGDPIFLEEVSSTGG